MHEVKFLNMSILAKWTSFYVVVHQDTLILIGILTVKLLVYCKIRYFNHYYL